MQYKRTVLPALTLLVCNVCNMFAVCARRARLKHQLQKA